MIGTNERRSKKMGNIESKEKKKTQKNDGLKLSVQGSSTSIVESKPSNDMESSLLMDAVPVSSPSSVFKQDPPSIDSSKLMIAKYVNSIGLNRDFDPFEKDISESYEELEKKIEHYQLYMDFEVSFGYHDSMILYHEKDEEDVQRFCDNIEKNVVLRDRKHPSIASYSRIARSCGNNFRALEFGLDRCTFVMLFITSNFVDDSWSAFSSEACLMEAITNPQKKWCVVPVFTEDKSSSPYRIPLSINTLKGIRYCLDEEDFYLSSITTLFNDRISVKIEHKEKQLKEQIKWVQNFEKQAREEALENLRRESERIKKHEEFLRSHGDVQSSTTSFRKANFVHEWTTELSLVQKNEQLKKESENVPKSLNISRADEGGDAGTPVDPQDLVSDTPSPLNGTVQFQGKKTSCPSGSSVPSQKSNLTPCDPPPVANVALTGNPEKSSSNQLTGPEATSEDLASKGKNPADTLPHTSTSISNPTPARSKSASHPSASSASPLSGNKTNINSRSRKVKSHVSVAVSCIDHPLSEESCRTVHYHHHHYSEPPVYNIHAENVQIGSHNKLYNRNQDFDSDDDDQYEKQHGCENSEEEEYNSNGEKSAEEKEFSNSIDSILSQDGAQSTRSQNAENTEAKVLQDFGIEPVSFASTNDTEQTRPKEC